MPQYHEQAPVLQAVAREVSRDPEIKALRAGKVPAPVNHGHSMPMGGVPPDAGGHPSNGMGLLGGGIAPGHGHVHTMDNRGRRPQPKPGDKRTSQGLHSGYVSPGLSTQPPTTFSFALFVSLISRTPFCAALSNHRITFGSLFCWNLIAGPGPADGDPFIFATRSSGPFPLGVA